MPFGKLTVVTGPMFSGKTSYLLNVAKSQDAIVIKPAMDIRYSDTKCVSHDGISVTALSVSLPIHLTKAQSYNLICFDEIQFFIDPHYRGDIIKTIQVFLRGGKDVLANGLDMNWKGDPFAVTASLCGMADEIVKLKARCTICGNPASKSYKTTDNQVVIELGNEDIYEARCNAHWTN